MTTLVLAEHTTAALADVTARAVTAAVALGAPVHVLVAGKGPGPAAEAAAKLAGVAKVIRVEADAHAHGLAEPLAATIVAMAGAYDALLAAATTFGKNVMPRVAALLDVMQVSDVTRVVARDTFERPIYAGNAIETVKSADGKRVLTVRGTAFKPAGSQPPAPIETAAPP